MLPRWGSGHCKKIVTHAGRGGALGDLDRGHPEMQSLPPHWLVIIVPHGRALADEDRGLKNASGSLIQRPSGPLNRALN